MMFIRKSIRVVFSAPTEKMRGILERTIQEAKDKISKVNFPIEFHIIFQTSTINSLENDSSESMCDE